MAVLITARCHPKLEGLIPPPVLAAKHLPDWLRAMPSEAATDAAAGTTVRTFKQCPPMLDAFGMGFLLRLGCDLVVKDGEMSWDWDFPTLPDHSVSRAPIGLHVPEQARGAPFEPSGLFVKFTNFWTLSVPEGWQLLFTHPFNRPDLPFQALTGLVDCDRFGDGYVHCPARWLDPGWEGVLPTGTPFAQVIAVPRETTSVETGAMTKDQVQASEAMQNALAGTPGHYRKSIRLRARD